MTRKSNTPALDLSKAQLTIVKPEILAERRPTRTTKERDKQQLALDALVTKAHAAWVKAGKPDKFWESPGGNVRVPEEQLVTVQRAIHNSGRYLNMKIRFGKVEYHDGYADVVFSAADRPEKVVEANGA